MDERAASSSANKVLAVLLFGVPGLLLLVSVSLFAAYGADAIAYVAYSAALLVGVALAYRGAARDALVAHGVAFAIVAVATMVLVGWFVD